MALELRPGATDESAHNCRLPLPRDPEIPEGHVCECGHRWVYLPAHWDPLLTVEELRGRQEAGDFLRGILPQFRPNIPTADPAVIVRIDRAPWNGDTT
jgi:hypothetical protein